MDWHSSISQDGKEFGGFGLIMSDIAIKVENLSKSYLIGHNTPQSERYVALRDVVSHNAKNLVRKTRDLFQGRAIIQGDEVEEFWALKDINFEIKQGDRVGIIGRNGAGKSTLLKILSRITEPTSGRISIHGRVASLLEVGTGFHPELTGRENIYLNGAILGMSKKEIKQKFDEIVDFAEVEKFLDTPVKRYSSGMYVRLAFAVAAHLEPEILIVDEVLAVGDIEFQKKCLGKMEQVSSQGRTIIFVSHNLNAISKLCNKGLLLRNGELIFSGSEEDSIKKYIKIGDDYTVNNFDNENIKISNIKIILTNPETIEIEFHAISKIDTIECYFAFDLSDDGLETFAQAITEDLGKKQVACDKPVNFKFKIGLPKIIPGNYSFSMWIGRNNYESVMPTTEIGRFKITQSPLKNRTVPHTRDHGLIVLDIE